MKVLSLTFLLATALVSQAQTAKPTEKSGEKPARKTLTFQPGSKTPDEPPALPASSAVAAPVANPPTATPAGPESKDSSFDLAAAFFGSLQKGLIEDAYANLTKGSKIGDRPEELRNLKAKTSEAFALFGQIHGFELIETKLVGTALRRYTFVSFGRDFPLRWRFYFYKTEEQWRLIDLHVDDRLAGIFEEQDAVEATPKAQ